MVVGGWRYDNITAARDKKTGRNPTDRGKQGVKPSLMTDTGGLPLPRLVAAADRHDIKLVADTPGALQTGRPGQKTVLCPDKGDGAPGLKTDRLSRRDEPYIPPRKEE
ncbi:transposase [Erwinia tracheiphila PSU-1]|nr:transposase [Erwinia tracheiphila PSU-1]